MKIKKIKIVYIVSTLRNCSPVLVLLNIVKYLDPLFEPCIITLSHERQNSIKDVFEKKFNIPCFSLNMSVVQGLLLGNKKLKKLLDEINPDVIHSHGYRADKLVPKNFEKTISTLHCNPFDDYTSTYPRFIGYLMAIHHILVYKKINKKVLVSNSLLKKLEKYIGNNTKVIGNGVDTEQYHPVTIDVKNKLREKLSINMDKTVFIFSGNFIELKNPELIINTFKKINDSKILLIMLGDGHLFNQCQSMIANTNNIIMRGRITNVHEYLQASDYFVSASMTEGLPVAVLEALACGIGVVLSNIDQHREVIENNEKAGILFDHHNADSFKNSIIQILKKDYQEMSKACVQLIKSNYLATTMSKKYQDVYLEKKCF